MQELKKLASLPNKIFKPRGPGTSSPTFERSVVYSALFHLSMMMLILGINKFNIAIWKKPPPVATVVWTQTVKRPKPTIPDKLPPPLVPMKKEEASKKDEINVKKEPEEKEESSRDKMKKALDALKNKVKDDDDRPAPKEDNFATSDENKPDGVMTDSELLAIQANPKYSAYLQTIKETVTSNFIWYKEANFSTRVMMKIDPKGNLLNTKIEKSSGDFSYDQAVLRAIQKSNPLPPPPEEFAAYFMQDMVEINFERKIR